MKQHLDEIKRLCEEGTQGHGDEFYGPILDQIEALERRFSPTIMGKPWGPEEFTALVEQRLATHKKREWADAPFPYDEKQAAIYHTTMIDCLVWVLEQCPPFQELTSSNP